MLALTWLSRFIHAFTRKFTPRKNRSRFRWDSMDKLHRLRLRLEGLEDRSVPALFTVLNTNDSGAGSLRQAVLDANANVGVADTIEFGDGSGSGGTNFLDGTPDKITLTTGQLAMTDAAGTTITGSGANLLTVSGNLNSQVFSHSAGVSVITGLTITEGSHAFVSNGGGVNNTGGTLTLNDCIITGNSGPGLSASTTNGGGVCNTGTGIMFLTNCTISDNYGGSTTGGILNDGTMTLTNCTISGNSAVRFNFVRSRRRQTPSALHHQRQLRRAFQRRHIQWRNAGADQKSSAHRPRLPSALRSACSGSGMTRVRPTPCSTRGRFATRMRPEPCCSAAPARTSRSPRSSAGSTTSP